MRGGKNKSGRRAAVRRPGGERDEPKRQERQARQSKAQRGPANVWRRQDAGAKESADDALARAASATVGPGGFVKLGDIPAYRLGRELRNRLYRLANSLDEDERPNLCARLKQAATAVTASLAAGFGEGTFRSAVSRALETRGALYAIQDHLRQAADLGMLGEDEWQALSAQVDDVIKSTNEYLGLLVRERNRLSDQA